MRDRLRRLVGAVNPKTLRDNARRRKQLLRQPVEQTRFVIVDLETTGLNAYAGDSIVSVAMAEYSGLAATGRQFVSLVNPERAIPQTATAIHGIRDADVVNAPRFSDLVDQIEAFLRGAVMVGHHIGFDLRFLNMSLRDAGHRPLVNPVVDTMVLFLEYTQQLGHYTLDEVARQLSIDAAGRHSAAGDVRMTGEIFRRLCPLLMKPQEPVARLLRFRGADDLKL